MTQRPQPIRYAIVRVQPYIETEEFANVGIVLVAPSTGYFDFKLETRRLSRLTTFFDQVDRSFLRAVLGSASSELARIRDLVGFDPQGQQRLPLRLNERADHVFASLTKEREGMIVYSDVRFALHPSPSRFLQELFAHYVSRSFLSQEYGEDRLEREMRSEMSARNLTNRFQSRRYDDGVYAADFPFIGLKEGREAVALKPLFLGQEQPIRILDHANKWRFTVNRFREKLPQHLTFAVEGPQDGKARAKAFDEAVSLLRQDGASVIQDPKVALQEVAAALS